MEEVKHDREEVAEFEACLKAVTNKHLEIVRYHVAEAEKWKDAYWNLRNYAESLGVDTKCRLPKSDGEE